MPVDVVDLLEDVVDVPHLHRPVQGGGDHLIVRSGKHRLARGKRLE